jgi:hypothetical protein
MLSALQQQPQKLVTSEIKDITFTPAEDNTAVLHRTEDQN